MGRLTTVKPRVQSAPGRQMAIVNPDSWREGKNSTQRGYGYKWQKARESFLAKHPLCGHCQAKGLVTVATDVDHIIPHRGNMDLFWQRSNWQPLCHPCHSVKTQGETAQGSL